MLDETRKLTFGNGVLTFQCGVKVDITEEKLKRIYGLFKLQDEFEKMIKYKTFPIPKEKAFQIKNYLT